MARATDLITVVQPFVAKSVGDRVRGGALATRSSRDAALYSQIRCVPHGRRVLCRAGIQGQVSPLVVDGTNPVHAGAQTYPLATATRILARAKARLTPGYVLAAKAIFLPSGPTQRVVSAAWREGVANAKVRIDYQYDNGVSTTSNSHTFTPSFSSETYKALPTGAGAAWGVIEPHEVDYLLAPGLDTPGWTEDVTVEITVTAIGGARPIDVVVFERPRYAWHDSTYKECTVSNFTLSGMSSEYPLTAQDQPSDPTRGSHAANKSVHDQRGVWGPVLAHWTCWNEDTAAVTASEGTATLINSTSFADVPTALSTYSSNNPGWSAASGAYGRTLEQSGPIELRDVNGCIPVTVRAYARVLKNADVGTLRFQTADYSYRDLTVTGSTSFGWYAGLAWLRVPVHASLDSHLQVLGKIGSAGQQMEVRYLQVEYGGHHVLVQ